MKFENILSKKLKELEVLSSSLVYKEKEILVKYRDKLEEVDLEENLGHYEKKGLLDEDSDEDDDDYFQFKKTGNEKDTYNKLDYSSDEDKEDNFQIDLNGKE